jgi:hypothetical protein
MKDNILEELKAYDAPKRLPPIADRAFALYEAGGFKLDDAALGALRAELEGHAGDLKALTDAIVGLGAFALWARDFRKDATAAEAVAKLIGEHAPKYATIGERLVNALQDLAIKATDWLDQLSGRDPSVKHRAPKYGDAGAPGSVPLKDLKPLNAPPPLKDLLPKKK